LVDILERALELVKRLEVSREDYEPPGKHGEKAPIHDKILKYIRDGFEEHYTPKLGDYGIDLVIREAYPSGRIILAVEVDTWWKPFRSWLKLLDIRSENKIWVYAPSRWDYGRAEERFERAVDELEDLVKRRRETPAEAGRLVAVLKMPDKTRVKRLLYFERIGRMVEGP